MSLRRAEALLGRARRGGPRSGAQALLAAKLARRVLRSDGACLPAYRVLAAALSLRRENFLAVAAMERAWARTGSAEACLYLARLGWKKSIAEALARAEKALELDPKSALAHGFRGELLRRQGKSDAALEALNAAVKLEENPRILVWRARALESLDRLPEAVQDLRRAAALNPRHGRTEAELAHALEKAGDFQRAERIYGDALRHEAQGPLDLEEAIETGESREAMLAWLYFRRFAARVMAGDIDGGIADLNEAHGRDVKYNWLGHAGEADGLPERALNDAMKRLPTRGWLFAWRAYARLRVGRYEEALEDIGRARGLGVGSAWLGAWRAEGLLRLGRDEEASAEIGKLRKFSYPAYFGVRAELELRARKFASAARDASRAIAASPHAVWAYALLGEALLGLGRYEEARRVLSQAVAWDPGYARAARLLSLASLLARDKDAPRFPFDIWSISAMSLGPGRRDLPRPIRARLIARLGRLIARGGETPPLAQRRAMRGWALFCAGRTSEALEDLQEALRLEPGNVIYRVWRGALYKAQRDHARALEDFSAAISTEPDAVMALFGRAEVCRNRGDWDKALEDAQRLAALEPRSGAAFRFLAKHRRLPEGAQEALKDVERALALEPKSAEGRAWQGELLRILGRDSEALDSLSRAIALNPRYGLAYTWRGALRHARGDLKGARRDLLEALRLEPNNARALAWLGRVSAKEGRPDRALRAFDSAIAADPNYAWAYHERFLLKKEQGDLSGALKDVSRAFTLDGKYDWFERHAAARPDFPELALKARGELEALAEQRPGDPWVSFWRERVGRALGKDEGERSYDIMLGYVCNILCRFCSQELDWRRSGWMPLSLARERIYAARRRGCRILNILGGEVTAYPDVASLVAFARRAGFETIQFETNGIRLSDRAFASALSRAGLNRVSVSVHGASAGVHDRLVKSPGAFERLLQAMDNLKELGVVVRAAFVLNKENYREVEEFCRYFWREKGVREFQFIYPLYTGDFMNHLRDMAVPMSETLPHLEAAFSFLEEAGCRPPNVHNMPPCLLPGRLGQLGDWQDLGMEILKPDGRQYQETRQTPMYRKSYVEACDGCTLRERCVGVDPEYLRHWGDAEIAPYPGKRELADTNYGRPQ